MIFTEVKYGTELYRKTCVLRDKFLRQPLGLTFSEIDLEGEKTQRHFAILDGKEVAACVIAKPVKPGKVKIRQMVVEEKRQKLGLGSQLLSQTENELKKSGINSIELNARYSVKSFYLKNGYTPVGKPFEEVTIKHIKMEKDLSYS